jgi:sphingomyelin phosphodiesterase acid-like 3
MVSDIHFDPFHDPEHAKALAAAAPDKWRALLAGPASPNQKEAFEALQQTCHARGVDTPYALFASSLAAMRAQAADAKFITVSGDLIAHAFTCRYAKIFPAAAPGDYEAFVVKTVSFVVSQLRAAFPGMPVYVALGNNDSGCGDYKLDAGGSFLAGAGKVVAAALPASQRLETLKEFGAAGYYSVRMAAPMRRTRLIVVNDLPLSGKYTTCGDKKDPAPAETEIAWLNQQLTEAQTAGEKVWVMGHIPPGIDPYSTVAKFKNVCAGQSPSEFLANDKMADELVDHAASIRLAIFAHTHMDELRLLRPQGNAPQGSAPQGNEPGPGEDVAIKLVASISPVDGNIPSFTIAKVNPETAVLADYQVVEASNQTGLDTSWTAEYDYAKTYHQAEFSPSALKELLAGFTADKDAKTDASQAYIRNYFVGDMSRELSPFWPEYVCALDNYGAKGFAACVCAAK